MEDINKFVEQQVQVPFTMKNIYSMIELIFLTHGNRMDKVMVQAFDKICSFSHDNSEAGEGWKTNSGYKVNQKFILPWITEVDWGGYCSIRYSSKADEMDDIVKALCYMTGKNYVECTSLYSFFSNDKKLFFGTWYDWNDFFKIKGFKKGTMHVQFRSETVWMDFNRKVSKIKGWQLPKKTDHKQKGTERARKEGVDLFNY